MLKKLVALFLLLFFTTACANQTVFLSYPAGAEVFVDGDCIGVTPCTYNYNSNTGKEYEVVIKKDGYDSVEEEILSDQVDQVGRKKWLVAGLVWSPLWLGTLFTKKLKDSYNFTLRKIGPVMNAHLKQADRGPIL